MRLRTSTPYNIGEAKLGVVTMTADPRLVNLTLPLRLK